MLKIGHEGCWISWPNRVWASWILNNEADGARLKMEVGIILANDSVKIPRPVKNGKINLWIRICYIVQGCRIYYIEWLPYSIVITKLLCSVRVWFWFSRKNIHMILKILIKQYIEQEGLSTTKFYLRPKIHDPWLYWRSRGADLKHVFYRLPLLNISNYSGN